MKGTVVRFVADEDVRPQRPSSAVRLTAEEGFHGRNVLFLPFNTLHDLLKSLSSWSIS